MPRVTRSMVGAMAKAVVRIPLKPKQTGNNHLHLHLKKVTKKIKRETERLKTIKKTSITTTVVRSLSSTLENLQGTLVPKFLKETSKEKKRSKPKAADKENCDVDYSAEAARLCIMFDTESTGLGTQTAEIIQLAALVLRDGEQPGVADSFNRFILPKIPIHWGATMVHKMKMKEGKLVRHGEDVHAQDAACVLEEFFAWCSDLQRAHGGLVLVAHNGARFDFPLLFSFCRRKGVSLPSSLTDLVLADSLPACRPCREQFGNCKLATLKQNLVKGGGSQTHDALDDCQDLGDVLASLAARGENTVWQMLQQSGAVNPVEKYQPM